MTKKKPSYTRLVGQNMRRMRTERALTLADVEKASGGQFKVACLGTWERGDRSIRAEALCRYAEWLGVSPRSLLPPDTVTIAERQRGAAYRAAQMAAHDLTVTFPSLTVAQARRFLLDALGGDLLAEALAALDSASAAHQRLTSALAAAGEQTTGEDQ